MTQPMWPWEVLQFHNDSQNNTDKNAFWFMCVNKLASLWYTFTAMGLTKVSNRWSHWYWCRSISHDFLWVFHCNYVSLSCTISKTVSQISLKIRRGHMSRNTPPLWGNLSCIGSRSPWWVCTSNLEVHSCTHSKDRTHSQNLKASHTTMTSWFVSTG